MMNTKKIATPYSVRDIQLLIVSGFIATLIFMTQEFGELLIRLDRFQHISSTMALFFIFHLMMVYFGKRNLIASGILALSVGFLKEMGDPSFQQLDIVSNFFGLFLALLAYFAFLFLTGKKAPLRLQ